MQPHVPKNQSEIKWRHKPSSKPSIGGGGERKRTPEATRVSHQEDALAMEASWHCMQGRGPSTPSPEENKRKKKVTLTGLDWHVLHTCCHTSCRTGWHNPFEAREGQNGRSDLGQSTKRPMRERRPFISRVVLLIMNHFKL